MLGQQFGIPQEELEQFQQFVRIYSRGKVIIREGQDHDRRIFLLRHGEVEVCRYMGERQQALGIIKAVNFFGEMAVISHKPRMATVIASSDVVVTYVFDSPNLPALLANPRWGTMLVSRLVEDFQHRSEEYERNLAQLERLRVATGKLLGAFMALQMVARGDDESTRQLVKSIPRLINEFTLETAIAPLTPDVQQWDHYERHAIIPTQLYDLVMEMTRKPATGMFVAPPAEKTEPATI
jgi:CRP-like cAMP-binding protein